MRIIIQRISRALQKSRDVNDLLDLAYYIGTVMMKKKK